MGTQGGLVTLAIAKADPISVQMDKQARTFGNFNQATPLLVHCGVPPTYGYLLYPIFNQMGQHPVSYRKIRLVSNKGDVAPVARQIASVLEIEDRTHL